MPSTHVAAYPLTPPAPASVPAAPASFFLAPAVLLLRFGAVMAFLLAAAAFPRSSFFTVSEISVLGARRVSAAAIVARSGLRPGLPLAQVDARDVIDRVTRHPWVASASVRVSPAGRVELLINERVPHAALPYRRGYLVLDHTGVAMEFTSAVPRLAVIAVDNLVPAWVRLGDRVPAPGVLGALRALAAMPQQEVARGIHLRVDGTGNVVVITADGITVLMGQARGLGPRALSLTQVLAAIRSRHLAVRSVDLRFAGSVILRPDASAAKGGVRP